MASVTTSCHIQADPDAVFAVIGNCNRFAEAVPDITGIEVLSDVTSGVGLRFRETRTMNGREADTVLEVTEYEPPNHIRIVADSHGTVWDSVFTVTPQNGGSELTLVMDARPHKLLSRLLVPFTMRMIGGALEKDLHAVKDFLESPVTA
ncbi:MAG: SRPBCC family protein [Rhodothermales bacterium]|nr:SRPBCC family protein [Rhodothermales bacterium]MBO6779326.1 SRPBCC family protein [Rhodothermales bacterium]